MVTLSRDAAGRYFASFKTEVEIKPLPSTGRLVGVDLGVSELAVLSTGEIIKAPKHYARKLRYLRRQQRILARKQKGSKRREKQKLRVAKAAAHVAAQRTYDLHQLTTRLVREFDVIAIEDLSVKALGRGLLAGPIHDAALSEFRRQLEYKAGWYRKTVIAVDRSFPSSKRCGCCGHVNAELRLGQGVWKCPTCGTRHNRNIAAAQNLLEEALFQMAGDDRRH
jgi:putative transposase